MLWRNSIIIPGGVVGLLQPVEEMVESWWWRTKAYGSWVVAIVAIMLAYFHGFALVTHFAESQDRLHLAANIYLATFFFAVVILAAWRQWISIRKERYANITPLVHQILHQIRDLNTFIKTREPRGRTKEDYEQFSDNCKLIFGLILDQLATIFRSLTSTSCRASIKLTYNKNGRLYLYTLTRDQGSRQRCLRMDNERVARDHDPLDENVKFATLFDDNRDVWHYLCNDLPRDRSFRGTCFSAYNPDLANSAPRRRWFGRRWPLPYKSIVTCVIRQAPFDMNPAVRPEVLGFLCVDSESRGVFEDKWDSQIMFAVADALYGSMRAFLDAQNRSPEPPRAA